MAKKKKSKASSNSEFKYSVELVGLLLVLIGLLGFGFGLVGEFIKKFALFVGGEWWPIILVLIFYMGCYMIVKRKPPKFFSLRMLGFYIIVVVILVASHFEFIQKTPGFEVLFDASLDNYMIRADSINETTDFLSSGNTNITVGGGIIGAVVAGCFSSLFGEIGTYIVLVILGFFGIVLAFDIDLGEFFEKIGSLFKRKERDEDDEDGYEEEEEVDNRVVISSVEDLKHHQEPTAVAVQAPVTNQVAVSEVTPAVSNEALSNHKYRLPSIGLLDEISKVKKLNNDILKSQKMVLERVLSDFQINGKVVEIHVGPSITQYEIQIPNGTKVNKIVGIHREIALAMAVRDVRIQAPIPGKSTIGVELPNPVISPVKIKEIAANIPPNNGGIVVCLGKDIMGRVQTADISKMPHLLVAGSTGSGKSVCINSIIASILLRYRPDEVKLVMVDPKKVELSNYNGVPHLKTPVVTNPKKASVALQKIVTEMERRYMEFSENGVKNIAGYNEWVRKQNEKDLTLNIKKMDYIVVIIDELADLMLVAAKEVEDSILRITQMARAAGIHLIVATQRPSTDVITGVVKANIPSRISFAVASQIDSRTILDMPGAEKLLGKGDMLYLPMGENSPIRIQGCFISDDEINRLIDYVCKEQVAQYDESLTMDDAPDHNPVSGDPEDYEDPLYNEIVEFAIQTGKVSASLLQRRFRLGYNRAARVVDLLEERGIVGPANGSKPREVLVKLESKE